MFPVRSCGETTSIRIACDFVLTKKNAGFMLVAMAAVLAMQVCFVAPRDDDRAGNDEHSSGGSQPRCISRGQGLFTLHRRAQFTCTGAAAAVRCKSLYERMSTSAWCGAISGAGVPAFLFRSSYLHSEMSKKNVRKPQDPKIRKYET